MSIICLKCGWCCINLDIIIVSPKYIDYDLDFDSNDIINYLEIKKSGDRCPHLSDNNECMIHSKPWYNLTPCYEYTQIPDNTECRRGIFEINKNKIKQEHEAQ